jgi:hypothetical protein
MKAFVLPLGSSWRSSRQLVSTCAQPIVGVAAARYEDERVA